MDSFKLIRLPTIAQDLGIRSFQGGSPNIPPDASIPRCKLCQTQLTFFFQVEFPAKTVWAGRTLCMFACTACRDLKYAVPKRPPTYAVESVVIPDGYLEEYQANFKALVFEQSQANVIRTDIAPRFVFEPWGFEPLRPGNKLRQSKVGGRPFGEYERQVPKLYMGSGFGFLMQLEEDWGFKLLPGAPPVTSSGGILSGDEGMLFWGLPVFFSGTTNLQSPQVWLLTYR